MQLEDILQASSMDAAVQGSSSEKLPHKQDWTFSRKTRGTIYSAGNFTKELLSGNHTTFPNARRNFALKEHKSELKPTTLRI